MKLSVLAIITFFIGGTLACCPCCDLAPCLDSSCCINCHGNEREMAQKIREVGTLPHMCRIGDQLDRMKKAGLLESKSDKELFWVIDKNGDGCFSREEFDEMWHHWNLSGFPEIAFAFLDIDEDGCITKSEWGAGANKLDEMCPLLRFLGLHNPINN